jgi:hypothetical protein
MDPLRLQRTIYLGDRAVKQVILDGWEKKVKIQIDTISRVRSPDGQWQFYTDEDIEDGFLVCGDVKTCTIEPPGAIPDDYVASFALTPSSEWPDSVVMELRTAGPTPSGKRGEIVIRVVAGTFYLEDPKRPGVRIAA